jgi:hypothetical protein
MQTSTSSVIDSRHVRMRRANQSMTQRKWPEEWRLLEWPKGEKELTKYWLSVLSEDISLYAKLRWRIEHDYLELKNEVGLGHFEGRGWRGFHHYATLSIAVHGFLISKSGAFPPLPPLPNSITTLRRYGAWKWLPGGPQDHTQLPIGRSQSASSTHLVLLRHKLRRERAVFAAAE